MNHRNSNYNQYYAFIYSSIIEGLWCTDVDPESWLSPGYLSDHFLPMKLSINDVGYLQARIVNVLHSCFPLL